MGLALAAGALALLLVISVLPRAQRLRVSPPRSQGSAAAEVRYPAGSLPLRVGLHVKNLYNLQLDTQTFSADGWYWLQWDQPLQDLIQREGLAIDHLVEFNNQVETWDGQIETETPEPELAPDGSRTQLFRFSARFYIDDLDLHDSPFETIQLPLVLETRPDAFSLERQPIRLVPSQDKAKLVGAYGDIAGYVLRRAGLEQRVKSYPSSGVRSGRSFSQLVLRVVYGSDLVAGFTKWLLPLLIVMIIVLLAPSLESSLGDIRLAIPSTALLTLVFLQQTYRTELPATPYPTFLDQLYAYCYLVAVGLFVLFVWSSNQFEATPEDQQDRLRVRINRIDGRCQWGALLGLGVWITLAWVF